MFYENYGETFKEDNFFLLHIIICEVRRSFKIRKGKLKQHEVHMETAWAKESRKTLTSGKNGLLFRLIEVLFRNTHNIVSTC